MLFDFDDYHQTNSRLDLLWELKTANPLFKCTVFAVPALGNHDFWALTPPWIELAVHGWLHPHPREAENWTYEETTAVLTNPIVKQFFVKGFKAPGWQISDATYRALSDAGWWVADQDYNDARRPANLKVYKLRGDSWHGHIQNVCDNGLEERFEEVLKLVRETKVFQFISEAVQ